MAETKIKRALIAVYDKTGVADFARTLVDEFGIEILSTGGTARHLRDAGIPVTLVEQITGFPEMLDGRVKTLHPKIHAAILADRDKPEHMRQLAEQGIEPIDMVVVNLYPFEETIAKPECKFEDAIEMIDIGGPCLLRAAAKNHKHVVVLSRRGSFALLLQLLRGELTETESRVRQRLAAAVFYDTSAYDLRIGDYLLCHDFELAPDVHAALLPPRMGRMFEKRTPTRYGENPHQHGAYYRCDEGWGSVADGTLPGEAHFSGAHVKKVSSFNNFLDGDSALRLCSELKRELTGQNSVVFIKHMNPCGVGVATDPLLAYRRAYAGDPNAAMGGILACSFPVTIDFARAVMQTYDRWGRDYGAGGFFVEVWVAPEFEDAAAEVIRTEKPWGQAVRRLMVGDLSIAPNSNTLELRSIAGGVLIQTQDLLGLNEEQWEVVTERKPTAAEMEDLRLAWLVCKHTKSNAISICRDGMLIGNGAGQMSRVMSCRIAVWAAEENGHLGRDEGTKGRRDRAGEEKDEETGGRGDAGAQHSALGTQHSTPVAASDAFFPFRDGPDLLLDAGVTAIIQPGGSKRDAEVIAACNARGAAMIFTHTRHFKH